MGVVVRFLLGVALLASALSPGLGLSGLFLLSRAGWEFAPASVVLLVTAALGIVAFVACLGGWASQQPEEITVTEAKRGDSQLLVFLNAYSIPVALAALNPSATARASAAMLAAFLALVYLRGRMFHLNPLFILAGFRLYECRTAHRGTLYVLTRAPFVAQTQTLSLRRVADVVYIQVGRTP